MALLDERQERPRALDRLAHLLEVGLAGPRRAGAASPALRAPRLSSVTIVCSSTSSTVMRSISASIWRSSSSLSCGSFGVAAHGTRLLLVVGRVGLPDGRGVHLGGRGAGVDHAALALGAVELGQRDVGARSTPAGGRAPRRPGYSSIARRLEVEQRAVEAVADRPPHVLLDQPAGQVGRRLPRVDLARRRGARRPTISAASASDSAPVVWASQMRTSTVPKSWCGRTDHHSWVNSTIEPVRTSRST